MTNRDRDFFTKLGVPTYHYSGKIEWVKFPEGQTTIKGDGCTITRIPPEKLLTLTIEEAFKDPRHD
jgi:hypothetical protein